MTLATYPVIGAQLINSDISLVCDDKANINRFAHKYSFTILGLKNFSEIFQPKGGKQVQIQDLGKGGAQLLRPKVADIAERSCMSKVIYLQLGF